MPGWRPGAVTKIMFRKYRKAVKKDYPQLKALKMAKQINKMETISPFITISKVHGEITVKVETLKEYNNNRLLHQYPYEKGQPVTYKIGRTDEENDKRQKKKERIKKQSRRQQKKYLNQTFGNKCREICLKAYQQAIGVLPITNPNKPECPCFPSEPDLVSIVDSCSESDAQSLSSDEVDWTIEFTPPIAKYDPVEKNTRRFSRDGSSQYDQLDLKLPLKIVTSKTSKSYSELKSGKNTVKHNSTKVKNKFRKILLNNTICQTSDSKAERYLPIRGLKQYKLSKKKTQSSEKLRNFMKQIIVSKTVKNKILPNLQTISRTSGKELAYSAHTKTKPFVNDLQVEKNFQGAGKLTNPTKQPIISNTPQKTKQLDYKKTSPNQTKLLYSPQKKAKLYGDHLILGLRKKPLIDKVTKINKSPNYRSPAINENYPKKIKYEYSNKGVENMQDNMQKDKRSTKKTKLCRDRVAYKHHEKKESVLVRGGGAIHKSFARNCCYQSTEAFKCLYNLPCVKSNSCLWKKNVLTIECPPSNSFNYNICDCKCN